MKHVLITGAARGVGLALTRLHLEQGNHVYALIRKMTPELELLKQQYPALDFFFCDISSDQETAKALGSVQSTASQIDIVYNVAGLNLDGDGIPLSDLSFDDCLSMYNVNALGPLRVLSGLLPLLHKDTVVVNVTSEAGSIGACERTESYGYCMSKAAANMATRMFSNAFPDIRTFCVHPGWVRTDMGGPRAKVSPYSISPEESAAVLYDIAMHPEQFPKDVIYLEHHKQPMPW